MRTQMLFYNYQKDQMLILDQELPEVVVPKLYRKGVCINQIDDNHHITLNSICICKWMIDEAHWFNSG